MKKLMTGLVFSKDRALQLDALLQTLCMNCEESNLIDINVIYKASNNFHDEHYNSLIKTYSNVNLIREEDIKKQVLSIIKNNEYVLFLVDDSIFIKKFSVTKMCRFLNEMDQVLGFSLRLGLNTKYCYARDIEQNIPKYKQLNDEFIIYNWTKEEYDFSYALEISSSIYRTLQIYDLINNLSFSNPNELEAGMANSRNQFKKVPYLICGNRSYAFSNPLNMVQNTYINNRVEKSINQDQDFLAGCFNKGFKIDVSQFYNFIPNSVHHPVKYIFIKK